MKSIRSYVIGELEKDKKDIIRSLDRNKKGFRNPIPISYTVGDGMAVYINDTSLENAIERMVDKNMPDTSDSHFWVVAHLANSKKIGLPKNYWIDIKRKKEKEWKKK